MKTIILFLLLASFQILFGQNSKEIIENKLVIETSSNADSVYLNSSVYGRQIFY
jgi:hypothetical protein